MFSKLKFPKKEPKNTESSLIETNHQEQSQQVTLVVTNAQELEAGVSPNHSFTIEGGTIGSGTTDNWKLHDHKSQVKQSHASIILIDNNFCLTDLSGACYINGATIPVGRGRSTRLSENDIVLIGPYRIRVHFADASDLPTGNQHDLEKLFRRDFDALNIGSDEGVPPVLTDKENSHSDPLQALDLLDADFSRKTEMRDQDIETEATEKEADFLLARDQQWQGCERTVHADSDQEVGSAMTLQHILSNEEPLMDDKILESLEEEMGRNYLDQKENDLNQQHKYSFNEQASSMEKLDPDASHIAAGPMLRGLGVNLSDSKDMASMQALTEEIGASLQAAIRGLLSLHQQVSESRYGMMNKNLQPIEDNPLRLGLSYQKTMQTMFDDERSSVHLSPPSAIEESLANLRHHNEVVQSSASDALHQVVGAFSPDVLLRRFSAYRRPGDSTPESIDAWAWNMYQSYYCELTSDRQQGFEKLFWEIFDQSYDKALRDKQSEQRSG